MSKLALSRWQELNAAIEIYLLSGRTGQQYNPHRVYSLR